MPRGGTLPDRLDERAALRAVVLAGVAIILLPFLAAAFPVLTADGSSQALRLRAMMEVGHVGGLTAMFCVAWYAPRGAYRLRPTLVACLCIPVALFAMSHLAAAPGMFENVGADGVSRYFGHLSRLAQPLPLYALALSPESRDVSGTRRWALLAAGTALAAALVWRGFGLPPQAFAAPSAGAALMPLATIGLCLILVPAGSSRLAAPEGRQARNAAVCAALAEACMLAGASAGDSSLVDLAGHVLGLAAVAAAFVAIYGDAVHFPYRLIEQARADALLAKERGETILRSIADGVVVVNHDLGVELTNPVAACLLGTDTPTHANIVDVLRTASPAGAPAILADLEECLRTNRSCVAREYTQLDTRGGLSSIVEHVVSPLRDGTGTQLGAVLVLHDVTTRHAMEQLLVGREEQFRTLAANSPDIIARYGPDCRCMYVNARYETLTGLPGAGLRGRTPIEAVPLPALQAQTLQNMIAGVIADKAPSDLELSWQRQDGAAVSFSVRAVPEFDDAGRVVSVLTVARDITALKRAERQLFESRALLRRLLTRREEAREQERKRIARDLHEELGQLLMALRIQISTLVLAHGDALPPLRSSAELMLAVIDRILVGMRSVVSTLRPTTLDAGIAVGLEWLVDDFRSRTGIDARVQVPEGKPALDDPAATAVFRIVQEALANVARHAGAGRVDVLLKRQQDHWLVKVRDDGKGFDTARVDHKGTGLHDMRERAMLLGGELRVSSAPNGGTLVSVRFPAGPASTPPHTR